MVEAEARPPVGGAEEGLEGAGEVDESVAHQEEHGQERRQVVHVAEEDPALADEEREQEGARRLAPRRRLGERSQERDDLVLRDRLQQAWRTSQTLQAGTERREERPDEDDPFVRPRDVGHHQASTDTLTEFVPEEKAVNSAGEKENT